MQKKLPNPILFISVVEDLKDEIFEFERPSYLTHPNYKLEGKLNILDQ